MGVFWGWGAWKLVRLRSAFGVGFGMEGGARGGRKGGGWVESGSLDLESVSFP